MKRKELKIKLVFQADGKLKTDSLIVARVFEKEHFNVMRSIRNLECSSEFRKLNFELTDYIDKNGDSQPKYEMSRDGFMFLAMGFTGARAAQWKESVINAFNMMEAELLKQNPQPYMPRGYPQMLEAARNDWKQVRKELIQAIGDFLHVHDRKRKSQFTDKIYIDLIEARARELREYFDLRFPYQLTRDYLHQLVQEAICEVEIRMTDAINTGTINSWEDFKEILDIFTEQARRLKELQNGRIPLPSYALPQHTAMVRH
jgi:Rha family phage regulatory protein